MLHTACCVFVLSALNGPEGDGGASASASVSASTSGDAEAEGQSDKWIFRWAPERHMFELGLWLGILIPNENHEFYDPRVVAQARYQRVAADLGVRFAYLPLRWLGGEFEMAFMPTQTALDSNALLYNVRGHVIGQLPWWSIAPFLVIGGGGMGVASGSGAQGDDIDASFHWGPGVKFFVNRWVALRLDFRHLVGARVGLNEGPTSHFEVLLGVSLTLGRKKGDDDDDDDSGDPDHDGYYGTDDKCPDDAGTYPDGCPAPDRDDDGVADEDDKCPDEPGPAPEGCPAAPDRDGDGVADDADKCPDEPGAKPDGCPPDSDGDGISDDEDQCPDLAGDAPTGCPPDSDGDGVYDPVDDCPKRPETDNGFEDEDGCPDKVPRRLRGFTGVMPGITFELGSARIARSSKGTLDEAVETLKHNPDYHVKIVGHTDNTGSRKTNMELSEKRAESVKRYLVRHGIEADRVTTSGRGPDKPVATNDTAEGRAENRRIEFKVRKRRRR
jgi:OOP family OmpA-OmpF porin